MIQLLKGDGVNFLCSEFVLDVREDASGAVIHDGCGAPGIEAAGGRKS